METIIRFKGVHRGEYHFEVAVLKCGHEHHGHQINGQRLAIGSNVECGICAAGTPHTPPRDGVEITVTSKEIEARARTAAMMRYCNYRGPFGVCDRIGFFQGETTIRSVHTTIAAAKRQIDAAKYQHTDGSGKFPLMGICSRTGEDLQYGDVVHIDSIPTMYEVVA